MKIDRPKNNPGFYKENHAAINSNLDKYFGDKRFVKKHLISFFGLSQQSLKLITDSEIEDFLRVAKFLAKRIINAQAQALLETGDSRLDILTQGDLDAYNRLLFHDISHSIGWFIFNNKDNATGNKYVPLFFQTKPEAVMNNARLIEQEGFAAIWQPQREGELPLSLALLRDGGMESLVNSFYSAPEAKEFVDRISKFATFDIPSNLEEYIRHYLYFLYNAIGTAENTSSIISTSEVLFPDDVVARKAFIKRNQEQYDSMVIQRIDNPPTLLVEMLTFIYENKESPRVLVDLFFKYAKPLIDRTR